jgi:hypothetical protein
VLPDLQERGIARALLARTMEQFDTWGTRQVGLFTFAQSPKHIALYQKHGFYARFLTALMAAPARRAQTKDGWSRFGALTKPQQEEGLALVPGSSRKHLPGPRPHGRNTDDPRARSGRYRAGRRRRRPGGIRGCQYGPKSEAGADICFIKFGAVRDGPSAERDFFRLIEACENLAAEVGMPNVLAGVNMARHEAYRLLIARGFRTAIQGVAMHRHNDPGYCRPGAYVVDDWR